MAARTLVDCDEGLFTVSTIYTDAGIETIAFEEGGQGRQIYVDGATHEDAVEAFLACKPLPETHGRIPAAR